MHTPDEVAATLGLDMGVIETRLLAIGFGPEERAALAQAQPAAEEVEGTFLDDLYRRLRAHPETAPLVASDGQVERLKEQQRRYLRELFEARVDWPYVLRRLWIGVVHHRVRLLPQWYLTTYAHFVCGHLPAIFRRAATPAAGIAQAAALLQAVFFDASLGLDSYGRSEEALVWSGAVAGPSLVTPSSLREGPSMPPSSQPGGAARAGYSRIRLSAEGTSERRAYLALTEEDLEALRSLAPLVEERTPAVLDDFYAFLEKSPETAALVPPETAARLKRVVSSYWLELTHGTFDRPHAASRMRIGVVHEKIGLSPASYLAGLARQVVGFVRAIDPQDPAVVAKITALVRAVFFDVSFVIDAYMEARADALLRTEGYANQLVAGLASAVAVIDAKDRLVAANRTLIAMIGADPAVLYLLPIDQALRIPEATALVARLRREHAARVVGSGRLGARSLRLSVMSLTSEAGNGALALILDDVTELLRIGQELDRESDQFDQLADAVGSVLWEMELGTWSIVAINRGALDLTGFRDVFFLGRPAAWLDRLSPEDRARFEQRASALLPGERTSLDYPFRRADGTEVWLRSRLARARTPEVRLMAATTDITASRRAEALRVEAIVRMAGGVAHVVNNRLAAVLGNIELLGDEVGGIDRLPTLRDAVAAAQSAASMAGKLLAFTGRQALRPEAVSLSAECRDALPRLRALLGAGVDLTLDLPEPLWPCRVDREMLSKALESLAANANEAMGGRGSLRISTRNLPAAPSAAGEEGADRDRVELAVSDSGHGMSPEVQARAFDPFFTTRSLAEASGLGLSLVHGFVTQSGGKVHIESEPGAGATVYLRFPAGHDAGG